MSRIEIPLSQWDDVNQYKVISAREQGLLLIRTIIGNAEDQLLITHLDTVFTKRWDNSIRIPRFATLLKTQVRKNIAYLLLRNRAEFLLVAIQVSDGAYLITPLKNPIPFSSTEFSVTDNAVLIGGYYNQRPLVFYYNFKQGQSKILPGFFNEIGELNQLTTNEDGSIEAIVSAKNLQQRKSLWIRTYDAEGDLLKTTTLEPDPDKNLISGKSFQLNDGRQFVFGSYGRYVEYARGLFSAEVNPDGKSIIQYHNFGELQHFFSYMKPKHEKRVMERIEKRKLKGKKLRYNYRYMVHEVMPYRDGFILLGEVFYPHYTYGSGGRNFGGFFGNALMRSELIFDGFQYTHAVVAGFDKNGQLLWDNSFKIENIKTMNLEQYVKIQPTDTKLDMLYVNQNSLLSKTIVGPDMIESKVTNTLSEGNPKNITPEISKLDNWYDGCLFAYGVLQIKNPVKPDGTQSSRRVFFINKIVTQ